MFPLYDGAVVVAFRCTVGQERELFGKVQAKEEARNTFKKAVKRHETAALLEEHTPEIFETVIGNIPAQTDIEVRIEYLGEAKTSVLDHTGDVIDIIIPMSIAPRYGESSSFPGNSSTRMKREGLSIEVKVTDSGTVKKLHCNHQVEIENNIPFNPKKASSLAELSKSDGKASSSAVLQPTQSVIKYASDVAIMDEDFVVSVENEPSHPLRSRAILSPSDENGLAAVMINIKPAEIFKSATRADRFAGEIVFVLDRSGSMGLLNHLDRQRGAERTKLATLKRAMPLSLSSLPETCRFNVVSFGSDVEFLWRQSMPYSNENLDCARRYLQRFEANMGGTDLLHALRKVVDSRRAEQSSTQIILVTDGEVESDSILEFVWNTRQELGDKIRFFALGIGFQVPHRLINRIGEFGGGYGEVVDIEAKPQWEDRLIVMLAAGLGPKSWNCTIDLGEGFERQSLMTNRFWDESTRQESESPGIVPYVQAPYPIPPMHPFAFRSVFLLLDLSLGNPPTKVILSATTDEAKPRTEHVLFLEPTKTDTSTIQHLAAKVALLGLKDEVDRQIPNRSQEELAQKHAVVLGTKYAVISRWTSYVAVQDSTGVADEVHLCKAAFIQGELVDFIDSPNNRVMHGVQQPLDPVSHCQLNRLRRRRTSPPDDRYVNTGSGSLYGHDRSFLLTPSTFIFIDRTEVADNQEAEGLFVVSDSLRKELSGHFSQGTANLLDDLVLEHVPFGMSSEKRQNLVDTLMIISYFETHLALQKDLWALMVTKARIAVLKSLHFPNIGDEDRMNETLKLSAMHVHMDALISRETDVEYCPFLSSRTTSPCPSCQKGAKPESDEVGNEGGEERTTPRFQCVECEFATEGWSSINGLWKHMVDSQHVRLVDESCGMEFTDLYF